MSVNESQYKLKIAIPVFVVVTAISFYFAVYKQSRSAVALEAKNISNSARQPASLTSANQFNQLQQNDIKASEPFETDLRMSCAELLSEHAKSASVSSNHVILKLMKCSTSIHGFRITHVDLVNKTNGYIAQVFRLNHDEFTSDFIQLEKGQNNLEFKFSLNDGQKKTQILKIDRIQ